MGREYQPLVLLDRTDIATHFNGLRGGLSVRGSPGQPQEPPAYGFSTRSLFMGPNMASSSFFSFSPTLFLSRAQTRSSTKALKSAVLMPMPWCASFMDFPVYLQGPPPASQI